MGEVCVSVYVPEDVPLDEHVRLNEAGDASSGWLYLGRSRDAALWGSPSGLRRVAAALVLLAERAEGLAVLRYAATAGGDGALSQVGMSDMTAKPELGRRGSGDDVGRES